jgi:hypothetical protein
LIIRKTGEEVSEMAVPSSVTEYKNGEFPDGSAGSNIISEYLKEKINNSGKQKAGDV